MANARVLERKSDVTKLDSGIINPWRWNWLEKVVDKSPLGLTFEKLNKPGIGFCTVCKKEINYGKRGCVALQDHVGGAKHKELLKILKTNYALPGQSKVFSLFKQPASKSDSRPSQEAPTELFTPLQDRVQNAEAMVLSFTAENSLSFSQVPKLINLAKALAHDKCALDQLSVDRTSASYKMTHGLAKTFKDKLVGDMQQNKFSLNIDEATSSNNHCVLAVMVSYFCPEQQKVVLHHFDSISVIKVDSKTLFDSLDKLFADNNIPWLNLVSVLMDSCNVMRGSKNGLEQMIRRARAPHLLDIDGDSCHHAHNAAKKFCAPFDYHVEGLMCDVHSDFKWSVDHREVLNVICGILGDVKYTVPQRYISHRWLSVYDVCVDTLRLFDAYTIFFFQFLPASDVDIYKDIVEEILTKHSVSEDNRKAIKKLFQPILKKKLTKEGKERKKRIVEKIFYKRTDTCLIMQLYVAVLHHLKKYVVLFQAKDSKVDKLHDEQKQLATTFLSNFIKPEALKGLTPKKLVELVVSDTSIHLPSRNTFIGHHTRRTLSRYNSDKLATIFMKKVKEAYIQCSISLLSKMPINKPILKAMSALDPVVRQHETTQQYLNKLPALTTHLIKEEDQDEYDREVRAYTINDNLPGPLACQDEKLDVWWAKVWNSGRYPLLTSVVFAVISCFHGPMVESSFSIMGDILDDSSPNMRIETYSAMQTIKYELMSRKQTSVDMFYHKEPKRACVNTQLCKNMRLAYRKSQEVKEARRLEETERLKSSGVIIPSSSQLAPSKRKFHETAVSEAEHAKLLHENSLSKRKKFH